MTPDRPRTPEDLASRYVWWQPADATLRDLDVLLWQLLKLGTAEDYVLVRSLWGETAFRAALARARPGALDERSWAFWHRHYGLQVPSYPRRRFA